MIQILYCCIILVLIELQLQSSKNDSATDACDCLCLVHILFLLARFFFSSFRNQGSLNGRCIFIDGRCIFIDGRCRCALVQMGCWHNWLYFVQFRISDQLIELQEFCGQYRHQYIETYSTATHDTGENLEGCSRSTFVWQEEVTLSIFVKVEAYHLTINLDSLSPKLGNYLRLS
jgi:hypothetical protein